MVTLNENEAPAREILPDELSESVARELGFTVAISSEENSEPTGAPMLDALTSYRKNKLN